MAPPKALDLLCTVAGVTPNADKSATFRLRTQLELTGEPLHAAVDLHTLGVRVIIAPENAEPGTALASDVAAPVPNAPSGKKWSVELRNQIYGTWAQQRERGVSLPEDFEAYYAGRMADLVAVERERR